MKILFICESPGKISKISSILGKKYVVKASVGHFRDLDPNIMSIDFDNHFEPIYIITKTDVVKNLKSAMKKADLVYLATDLDREGEAISQHLLDVLKPKKYKRLIFNAITKEAILESIKKAGDINHHLVNAQKARRVIDRLCGYLISPLLQRHIGGKLSAGRVQSIAAKIVIDKENEINQFIDQNKDSTYFKVNGIFSELKFKLFQTKNKNDDPYVGKAAQIPLNDQPEPQANVRNFLNLCLKSQFTVYSINKKTKTKSPSPPFETATLQQEANRKFGMSVDTTMKTAQKLYEAGLITYMRTDSVEISPEGHDQIKKIIEEKYGEKYYQKNVYQNKSANAQEAHEAIRPIHLDVIDIEDEIGDENQIKLYKLIWQRTVASQMKPAKISVLTIQVNISQIVEKKSKPFYYFQSQIEKVIFPGFMVVYTESVDDPQEDDVINDYQGKIPKLEDQLIMEEIKAIQEYKKPPPRYSEASLVKKLKDMEIGRPSTYVNTIKTIMDRKYVEISNNKGIKKNISILSIKSKNEKPIMKIYENTDSILLGKENKKIIPTSLGINVNDFLVKHFSEIMDYQFTAKLEKDLDSISNGKKTWHKIVKKFYDTIIPIVNDLQAGTSFKSNDILLGVDDDGNEIYKIKNKYGEAIKKGVNHKYQYISIIKPYTYDNITLIEAIELSKNAYPKILGKHQGKEIFLKTGKHGFYLSYDDKNYVVNDQDVDLKQAIKIISEKDSNCINEFVITKNKSKIYAKVLKGQYGPYIHILNGKKRTKHPIPKKYDPLKLSQDDVLQIISSKKPTTKKKQVRKNGGSKSSNKKKTIK